MKRSLSLFALAGLLASLAVCPARAQQGGTPPASQPPSQPGAAGGGNRTSGPANAGRSQQPEARMPLYVEGRVLGEDGQPVAETIPLKLSCGMRTLQVIRADIRGYFQFALGMGARANADFSAAEEAPLSSISTGINVPGGYSGFGTGDSLTGCELSVSVPGYLPVMRTITDVASLGIIDVGVLQLRRTATAAGAAVSATSLLAPSNARKEYEQGMKDLRSNRMAQATQHLEKAVAAYDKYAAAWNELGRLYAADRQLAKARQSYEKAIAADPKFAPSYVGVASVVLQDQDYEGTLEYVGKAAELEPDILMGPAGYIQAVANLRLNRLDAAIQGAVAAEKAPHFNIPQLHAVLADIYMRKQDASSAAAHIRAYLKEAPQGHFAPQLKKNLEDLEKSAANAGSRLDSAERP
jgi:tetratricopeptide (TPR) repeat protein